MKKLLTASLVLVTGLMLLIGIFYYNAPDVKKAHNQSLVEEREEKPIETKIERQQYYFRLLRDPTTNRIPENIRERELDYARTLPARDGLSVQFGAYGQVSSSAASFSWASVGPNTLGGRTRALAIDQTDENTIIAGGVSGGIWKSTDGGTSWSLKTDPQQNMSVTYVAQDPTTPTTWYYASGEIRGNSAGDRGFRARYFGTGIWKSTDNGETWNRLSATEDTDTGWNSRYDFITKIVISPTTGTVFAASNGWGVLRSTDDGSTWDLVNGGAGEHGYVGLDVGSDGRLVSVLSENDAGATTGNPGVFISTDDGLNWTEVTPNSFPANHNRSVVDFAPSDSTIFYTFTDKDASDNQGVSFHKFTLNTAGDDTTSTENRSANLPNFGSPVGDVNTQFNYNMVVAVKPDDPNFVLVGATNLFRSFDGFDTAPTDTDSDGIDDDSEKGEYWIGGYARANNVSQYANQHPDQHVVAFDPTNPNKMYSGHDGGLSVTTNITQNPLDNWVDQDNGYITSQFYTVALPEAASDDRIMGGTQDNGTPYYRVDPSTQQQTTSHSDISSGDGSYAHFTDNYFFVSSQRGRVIRRSEDTNGDPTGFDRVDPSSASNQLFIHPFEMDPHLESIMYYPAGTSMWRNKSMDQSSSTISSNWQSFSAVSASGYQITTLEATVNPTPVDLYFGASSSSDVPKIFLLSDARNSTSPTEISISAAPSGAYVHDIAVNSSDKQELIVVMSNYNITGLYHSTDAGTNWQAIEGNLTGGTSDPGPSLRNATIVPTNEGTFYFVATSTGVFMTDALNGSTTQWTRQAANTLGYAVSEFITSRTSDHLVAVGTHGRGIYTGKFVSSTASNDSIAPTTPTNLFATVGAGSINLDWDDSQDNSGGSGLNNYLIYRGNDSESLSVHDSVSASSGSDYVDTTNVSLQPYFYRVTAQDNNGNESDSSGLSAVYRGNKGLTGNWQLVSSPLDSGLAASIPSGAKVIGFDGAYQVESGIASPAGYWVKGDSASPGSIGYDDRSLTQVTITLDIGWNLIGSLGDTITTADISDPNNVLSAASVQEYSGGTYSATNTLLPTRGYWIHADKKGDITLTLPAVQSSTSPSVESGRRPITGNAPTEFDEITFRSDHAVQVFRVSHSTLNTERKQRYLRPPLAPDPLLDVRTAGDYAVADAERTELDLTAASYPVTVSLDSEARGRYRIEGIDGDDEIFYTLEPGGSIQVVRSYDRLYLQRLSGREQVLKNELLPNYPNPFNPATTIQYRLASPQNVTLQVFDILGREVKTLVDKRQQPGNYTVRFDASRLSSGMYFLRIRTDAFTQIQKMTLIK